MVIVIRRPSGLVQNVIVEMRNIIIIFLFFFCSPVFAEEINIKCKETTGTGRFDIFKINNPEFYWYYDKKWYELAVSKEGVAKDWEIRFFNNKVRLFNKRMEWLREIDLEKMSAYMKFPSGEFYLYKCKTLE